MKIRPLNFAGFMLSTALGLAASLSLAQPTQGQTLRSAAVSPAATTKVSPNPRAIVLTDISGDPDDQESTVRLLLYSNEISIEGLVAVGSVTSANLHPDVLTNIVNAYAMVQPNLLKHNPNYPTAGALAATITTGQTSAGMAGVGGSNPILPGAQLIINSVDKTDPRPVNICILGGTNTVAEALYVVQSTRAQADIDRFVAKLRVYSISDQDNTGPWVRSQFPNHYYIVKPSPPDTQEYYDATWTGFSGDFYYHNCTGADSSFVTNDWLAQNIRSKVRWARSIQLTPTRRKSTRLRSWIARL